jgi:hypothetical protein
MQSFSMIKQVVHIKPQGFKGLSIRTSLRYFYRDVLYDNFLFDMHRALFNVSYNKKIFMQAKSSNEGIPYHY